MSLHINHSANGLHTEVHTTPVGLLAIRGKREIHFLGASAASIEKSKKMLADYSFNRLYKAAQSSPIKNARSINNKNA